MSPLIHIVVYSFLRRGSRLAPAQISDLLVETLGSKFGEAKHIDCSRFILKNVNLHRCFIEDRGCFLSRRYAYRCQISDFKWRTQGKPRTLVNRDKHAGPCLVKPSCSRFISKNVESTSRTLSRRYYAYRCQISDFRWRTQGKPRMLVNRHKHSGPCLEP